MHHEALAPPIPFFLSISTEFFISEVAMTLILIPSSESVLNILAATPDWLRIPMPTAEIFATFVSAISSLKLTCPSALAASSAFPPVQLGPSDRKSHIGEVFLRDILNDHIHVDAVSERRPNIAAAVPGRSATDTSSFLLRRANKRSLKRR